MLYNSPKKSSELGCKRIQYLDVAKGISIFLVIIGHLVPMDTGIGQYIYSFHMPVFFVLSGVLMYYNDSWKKHPIGDVIKKKMKSLLYPYFMFSSVFIICILVKAGIKIAIRNLISTIIFEGIIVYWFLPALFVSELLFVICYKKRKSKYAFWLFGLLTMTFSYFKTKYSDVGNIFISVLFRFGNIMNRAVIGTIFIILGYYFIKITNEVFIIKNNNFKRTNFLCLGTTLVALLINICLYRFNYVDLNNSIIGNPLLFYINAVMGSYTVIMLSLTIFSNVKIFSYFGKNSLIVFATHLNFQIVNIASMIVYRIMHRNVWLLALIITIIFEFIIVQMINRYFRFLLNYDMLVKYKRND